jgi:hypothetical protein
MNYDIFALHFFTSLFITFFIYHGYTDDHFSEEVSTFFMHISEDLSKIAYAPFK